MKTLLSALLGIGLFTATTTPTPAQDRAERLGAVRFATSCAPAIQPRFDRAVAIVPE